MPDTTIPAEIAAALMQDHAPVPVNCNNLKHAATLLKRCGYQTVDSVGYGTRSWLCARRKGVKRSYTAIARWEAGRLYVWGDFTAPARKQLSSADVGKHGNGVRLPAGVWAWTVAQLGEEIRKGEKTAGPAIRRAYMASMKKNP